MSYYFNYYLAKRPTAGGKVSLCGPYRADGKPCCVLSRSRSYASDLHEEFRRLPSENCEQPLLDAFSWESPVTGERTFEDLKWLPMSALGGAEPFRSGYVLVDELLRVDEDALADADWDPFAHVLAPSQYAAFCQSAYSPNGRPLRIEYEDALAGELAHKDAWPSDYVRHSWVVRRSREYEAWLIRSFADELRDDLYAELGRDHELVVIETEG